MLLLHRCILVSWVFLILAGSGPVALKSASGDDTPPFTVPEGFSVQRVADDLVVHDCFSMTMDGLGRPVVSGPGYIRTLVDDNQDGIYDRTFLWSNMAKQGAQGLWSEGRKLYFVSEGALWLSEDADGDLAADANPKRVLDLPTGGEHDVHAIRRGPDGFWYFIAGNFAKDLAKLQTDPLSPVGRSRSGTVWRISPDFKTRGVWAHGMRNCYDFDFLPDGQIVTFDSDCEREATLPWYRPTRVFVLGPGSDAGWCGQAWKDEDHRITMPQTLAQLGRGSPTGVAVYQHRAFPKKYHDAVFVLDWTFGRVLALFPSKNLDESQRIPNKVPAEVFMQPSGNAGFAPTDVCVAPDGSLLVCVGGRGTTGAIYRIVAQEQASDEKSTHWFDTAIRNGQIRPDVANALQDTLMANMPFESWSEVQWRASIEKAGVGFLMAVVQGELEIDAAPEVGASAKLRAAQMLTRMNANVPTSNVLKAVMSGSPSTRAAGWWLAGRGRLLLKPEDANWIAQAASMNYNSFDQEQLDTADRPDWDQHLGPADERLRWEAFGLRKWPMANAESRVVPDTDSGNSIRRTWLWALARSATPLTHKSTENVLDGLIAKALFGSNQTTNIDTPLLDKLANWVPAKQQQWTTRDQLEFFTILQVCLGERRYSLPQQVDPPQPDVLDGYKGLSSSRLPENLRRAWTDWALFFAQKAIDLDSPLLQLEATRTLSMLEPKNSEAVAFLLEQITEKSHPTSDIHWLCCSANCLSPRSADMTKMTAQALAGIIRKVKQRGLYTDNQWPIRLQQLVAALLQRDTNLGGAFVDLPIPCCPEDLALLSAFPIDVQANARSKMKRHLVSSETSDWSPAILRYACQAGIEDALAVKIREASADPKLKTVAIELLATRASETDYGLFLSALESQDRDQWALGWKGIASLPTIDSKREMTVLAPIVSSVLNSNTNLPRAKVLQRVRLIGTKLEGTNDLKAPSTELWLDWERYFMNTLSEDDFAKLLKPNIAIDWTAMLQQASLIKGDSGKGKILYQEKCALCHGGQSSLGPSLSGVAKRFSREDLSKAIFEPSRDISERYRAIRVLTIDDEIYTGMIVYNAADGTTLQTATGSIVRINQDNIQDKGYSTESLMPSGLLDDKSPQDVANLFAYLDGL